MNPLEITLVILLVTIIAFVSGKVPFSVISTGIILALIVTSRMRSVISNGCMEVSSCG